MSESLYFSLHISPAEYQRYYRGTAAQVLVRATDGRRVQFPAAALREFVAHDGVHGHFCLLIDDNQKMIRLERIPPPAT